MDFGDIFDTAFKLYKRNFVTYLGIILIIWIPALVILGLFIVSVGDAKNYASPASVLKIFVPLMLLYFFIIIFAWPLSMCAITWAISENYLGKKVTIKSAYAEVFRRKWKIIGTFLLLGIIIMMEFLLIVLGFPLIIKNFLLPGIVLIILGLSSSILFMLWSILLPPVMVIENKYNITGLWRSKKLFQDSPGKVLLLIILMVILSSVIQMILSFVVLIPVGVILGSGSNAIAASYIGNVLSQIGGTVLIPFAQAGYVLLYYDIRIRKEGMDLEILAENLGYREPAGYPPVKQEPYEYAPEGYAYTQQQQPAQADPAHPLKTNEPDAS